MANASEGRHMVDAGLGSVSAVVSSLPAGYTLGEVRHEGNVKYKLVYNAGNSQASPGYFLTGTSGSAGAFSMTVSTASKSYNHFSAGLVVHATLTTGTYGWVAVKGAGLGVVADNTSIPTAGMFYIASNGAVELAPQSVMTGNVIIGQNLGASASKTVTTGTKSGDCIINLE